MHDKTNYSLGPHTDHSAKILTLLVYLASDLESESGNLYGTSIYAPKKNGFVCNGKFSQ